MLHHDTVKRQKSENGHPSMFTLALTVDSEHYASLDEINVQDLYKTKIENRPVSSDSDGSLGKKRTFSEILLDPPKFRMSRKKARQLPPDPGRSQDYVVFDAIREPLRPNSEEPPPIRTSGIPDEIQSGDPSKDAGLNEILQSYLTIDHNNRAYISLKDEYVYDIYYHTAISPAKVPTDANFGVLVYESEPELMDDEEHEDDEEVDSNSEGYYQNSYPDEDEWTGDGWGTEEEEDEYGKRRSRKIVFDSDDDIGLDSGDDWCSYPEDE